MERLKPALKLKKSPLVYIVAQVSFSAVEAIAKYLPDIQDEFRKRFPRFTTGETRNIRISPNAPPDISFVPRFEFQNRERTCGIVLQKDSVAVHVSRYSSFEEFCLLVQTALDTVHKVVTLGLIDRIGLRYVDLIRMGDGETLDCYLQPGLLGLDDRKMKIKNPLRMSTFQGFTDAGRLNLRMSQRLDGGTLPPDIDPTTLIHSTNDLKLGEIITLLDIDHFHQFIEEQLDFSTDKVLQYLWKLHEHTDLAFRSSITDYGLKVWGAEETDETC